MTDLIGTPKVRLTFISHGCKCYHVKGIDHAYILPKADLYLDCRVFPEPHGHIGAAAINDLIACDPHFEDKVLNFVEHINDLVKCYTDKHTQYQDDRRGDPVDSFTICCVCSYGMNRSPAIRQALVSFMKQEYSNVYIIEEAADDHLSPSKASVGRNSK